MEQKKTVEQEIVDYLAENGQKISWLGKKLGVSVGHISLVLKGEGNLKRDLTQNNLDKINEALRTNFKF